MEKKMSNNILETLSEGIVERNVLKETQALVGKWEKSGLLEGLKSDYQRTVMARLLENQAAELLKEANTMAGGDVQGFAAVAFPIVRRVFAGLIANDLVSVQPMSLPSGLVFFLDFKRGERLGLAGDPVKVQNSSVFGDRLGSQLTGGVRLDGRDSDGLELVEAGFYSLANGYGRARYSGSVNGNSLALVAAPIDLANTTHVEARGKLVRFDPDVLSETTRVAYVMRATSSAAAVTTNWDLVALQDLASLSLATGSGGASAIALSGSGGAASLTTKVVRRLTRVVEGKGELSAGDVAGVEYLEVVLVADSGTFPQGPSSVAPGTGVTLHQLAGTNGFYFISFPLKDRLSAVGTGQDQLGILKGDSPFALEGSAAIPELELKVDSFSITAQSRKLKASWTPELGQDLNAYHNLDAEVELTSILSEQIGLEIDQEILNDLVKGATAGTLYWSRRPGKFVNRKTGVDIMGAGASAASYAAPPDFTGNVSMWYETLVETINDVSAAIYRKTLRGGANFLVCGPEVANVLEFTAGFRASVTHEAEKGSVGAVKVGELSKKWDIIVDPYFLRNVILVGRKGGSFLESGYVYSPYVPLQTTPTIFDPNTFVPRKAVMTRYGKAMVRPDMYGLVVVRDLEG
jgi:hypothetical protein